MRKYTTLIGALILSSFKLYAAPSDVFGIDAVESAMAQSGLSSRPGTYSARGNPALLPLVKKGLSLDSAGQFYQLDNANIQSSSSASPSSGLASDLHQASNAHPSQSLGLGFTFPFSQKLAFGLASRFPGDSVAKVHAFTENEANYLHFDDRQARPEIFTGLGFSLTPWLNLGAGLYYSLKAKGTVQLGISQTDAESRLLLEVAPEFIPYFGLAFIFNKDNGDQWIWGGNYRFEQKAEGDLKVDLDFDVGLGTIPFSTASKLVAFYDPAVISVGQLYKTKKFNIALNYEFSHWSGYKPPVISLSGKDLDTLNSGKRTEVNLNLKDTHSLRLGMEWPDYYQTQGNVLYTLRYGLEGHTSAVGKNTNNVAIVDSNRVGLNLGHGFTFPNLSDWIVLPFSIDFAFKALFLIDDDYQDNLKSANRRSHSGGQVYNAMMGVHFEL